MHKLRPRLIDHRQLASVQFSRATAIKVITLILRLGRTRRPTTTATSPSSLHHPSINVDGSCLLDSHTIPSTTYPTPLTISLIVDVFSSPFGALRRQLLETRLSSVQSWVGYEFIKKTLYHQNKESHSTQWIATIRVTQIARRNTITHKFTIYRYNTSTSEMILAKHISSTSEPTLSVGALVSSVAEEQG